MQGALLQPPQTRATAAPPELRRTRRAEHTPQRILSALSLSRVIRSLSVSGHPHPLCRKSSRAHTRRPHATGFARRV